MRRSGRRIILLLFCIILFVSFPVTVSATNDSIENEVDGNNDNRFGATSPWLKNTQDDSIYSNSIDAGEDEQNISPKKPGRVEKYISELLRNISSAIISLLQDSIGASLDNIVYGRVGSGQPNKVNIYAFELRKGNPYGVTAAVCYALLRGMMFIFLGVTFVFQLVKAAWSGQNARSREEIKSMLPTTILKFTVLFLMPYFFDVALYVRDVLLYGLKEVTAQMITGGATLSLSKAFLVNAERSGTFVDAVMYLGTVVLTVYFVFIYVAVAVDMLICFVSFPFICVLHSKKRDLIGGWIMTVFSNFMTPVIDAVLLLVPLLTSLMLSDVVQGVAVIQLVMCMLLIPARVRFKGLLGIQSNERNGFLGAMAAMTLAKAIGSKLKQGAGKIADAVSDVKKSRMYGEMAEVDKDEEDAYLSAAGFDKRTKSENLSENITGDPVINTREGEDETGSYNIEGGIEKLKGEDFPKKNEEEFDNQIPYAATGMENMEKVSVDSLNLEGNEDAKTLSRNDILRKADQDVNQAQENIDGLKVERSGMVQKSRQLQREMLEHKRGSERYQELEKEKADVESKVAEIDGNIASETNRLNSLRQQSKSLHTAMGTNRTPTSFEDRRADIIRKRANISNFEQPDFTGVLSNEQMRDLYRKRAVANTAKAVASTGGALAFGTVAGGATVFIGGSASALSTAGGMQIGGTAGELSVDAAIGVGRAAKKIGHSAYNAADMAASAYLMNKIKPIAVQTPLYKVETGLDSDDIERLERGIAEQSPETVTGYEAHSRQQIQEDSFYAVQQILSAKGSLRNSTAILAMQKANLRAEKEIAIIKEENASQLTEDIIREKRIRAQADALSEAVVSQLETKGYEKGSASYQEAYQMIQQKVKKILEEKNRPLM